MDMAVANLFKHNVNFHLVSEEPDHRETLFYSKGLQYSSREIENMESIGVLDWRDLCLKRSKPFIVHIISTIVNEEGNPINNISVKATLRGERYDDYDLVGYNLNDPEGNIVTHIYSFPENLLNEPFHIDVKAYFYLETDLTRALNDDVLVPIILPDETFREDYCVVCLELKPNILYLDCMHIAVCVSCDNMKRTVALRNKCDVCRATISRRIKI